MAGSSGVGHVATHDPSRLRPARPVRRRTGEGPLPLPVALKLGAAVCLLAASQFHLWSRLSSGSIFAPEFPRALVILFNGALGATVLLAYMQLALDTVAWTSRVMPGGGWVVSTAWRCAAALVALLVSPLRDQPEADDTADQRDQREREAEARLNQARSVATHA